MEDVREAQKKLTQSEIDLETAKRKLEEANKELEEKEKALAQVNFQFLIIFCFKLTTWGIFLDDYANIEQKSG